MRDRIGAPDAAGICCDNDAAFKQVQIVNMPPPHCSPFLDTVSLGVLENLQREHSNRDQ